MVKHVRRISAELRPGILDDLGLLPAIEWHAREWQERSGVRCDVSTECEAVALTPEQSTALFRIFQESLTNIARHAGATKVSVQVTFKNGAVQLLITDDGCGFKGEGHAPTNSFGLLGMRERAAMLQGEFEIGAAPGGGTRVAVTVPFVPFDGADSRLAC